MSRFICTLTTSALLVLLIVLGHEPARAASAEEIEAKTNEALETLYSESAAAKELGAKARGMLVFPSITKGGLIVGGEYGEGALRVDGTTQGYYSSASGSIGLQVGISSRSMVIMFMTDGAFEQFIGTDGWEAGVDERQVCVERVPPSCPFSGTCPRAFYVMK